MPGIWGLAQADTFEDSSSRFQVMGDRLMRHDFYRREWFESESFEIRLGRISLGIVDNAPQPVRNKDHTIVCMIGGEIYDTPQLRRDLTVLGHQFHSDSHAEVLLHGYESEGRDFFRRVHGCFCAAIWDARAQELFLTCDRFGTRPLYYSHARGRLLFAPEIKAILFDEGSSNLPNLRGLAQFFTFGHFLNHDTFHESISVLPAAGWLKYSPATDRFSLSSYSVPIGSRIESIIDPREALERFLSTFRAAVARRVSGPGNLGLSLSGGLDSRAILAAIDTEQTPVTTVGLGMPGSIDLVAASRMSDLKGCAFHAVSLNREFLNNFREYLVGMVDLTDGHYLCQCIVMPTLPLYRSLGIDTLLRGHAGELLHMKKAYNYSLDLAASRIKDEQEVFDWLFQHLKAYMVETVGRPLFVGRIQRDIDDLARDSLVASVRTSRHIDNPRHRIWHHFVTQRLRRETTLSMVEFGSIVETRLPYLDNDLIDLVFNTSPELKHGETVQAYLLQQLDPRFLQIPNANTGARVGAGRLERSACRFRLKVLAKLGASGFQPYERLGLWLRRELRPIVEELLLSEQCFERGLFDPTSLRSVVLEHVAGRKNHTYLILALMIVEQGLRTIGRDDHASDFDGRNPVLQPDT